MVILVSVQYEQWNLETFGILNNGSKGILVLSGSPPVRSGKGLSDDQWTQSILSSPAPNPQTNDRIQDLNQMEARNNFPVRRLRNLPLGTIVSCTFGCDLA